MSWNDEIVIDLDSHIVERADRFYDDYIDPARLSPLTRRYLKEAFRAVASVQKGIASELHLRVH